jgi:hypothetical protein
MELVYNIVQMPPKSEKENNSIEKAPDYKSQVEAIFHNRLTPENIDTYTDEALEELIAVVVNATAAYKKQPTVLFESDINMETAAFKYYGLTDIG